MRAFLVSALLLINALRARDLDNMTLHDFDLAESAFRVGQGRAVSIGVAGHSMASFAMHPHLFAALRVYVRSYRGRNVTMDRRPLESYIFGTPDGRRSGNVHIIARRFSTKYLGQNFNEKQIKAAWTRAATHASDATGHDFKRPVLDALTHDFKLKEGESTALRLEQLAGRTAQTEGLIRDHVLDSYGGLFRVLERELEGLGHDPDEALKTLGPQGTSPGPEVRAREDNLKGLTPKSMQAELAERGVPVSIEEATKKRRKHNRESQKESVSLWLDGLDAVPSKADIEAFVAAHNLSYYHRPTSWRTIRNMYSPPPLGVGMRRAGTKATQGQPEESKWIKAILEGSWPGLEIRNDLPGRGRGIYTTRAFKKGTTLCHYNGEVRTGRMAHDYIRTVAQLDTPYLMEFRHEEKLQVVDGVQEDGTQGRLINQSYR